MTYYHDILYDAYGQSVPITADDYIEYLLHNLYLLRCERDGLQKQLDNIRLILKLNNHADVIVKKSKTDF